MCANCHAVINGARFRCLQCPTDLCGKCKGTHPHTTGHLFIVIRHPLPVASSLTETWDIFKQVLSACHPFSSAAFKDFGVSPPTRLASVTSAISSRTLAANLPTIFPHIASSAVDASPHAPSPDASPMAAATVPPAPPAPTSSAAMPPPAEILRAPAVSPPPLSLPAPPLPPPHLPPPPAPLPPASHTPPPPMRRNSSGTSLLSSASPSAQATAEGVGSAAGCAATGGGGGGGGRGPPPPLPTSAEWLYLSRFPSLSRALISFRFLHAEARPVLLAFLRFASIDDLSFLNELVLRTKPRAIFNLLRSVGLLTPDHIAFFVGQRQTIPQATLDSMRQDYLHTINLLRSHFPAAAAASDPAAAAAAAAAFAGAAAATPTSPSASPAGSGATSPLRPGTPIVPPPAPGTGPLPSTAGIVHPSPVAEAAPSVVAAAPSSSGGPVAVLHLAGTGGLSSPMPIAGTNAGGRTMHSPRMRPRTNSGSSGCSQGSTGGGGLLSHSPRSAPVGTSPGHGSAIFGGASSATTSAGSLGSAGASWGLVPPHLPPLVVAGSSEAFGGLRLPTSTCADVHSVAYGGGNGQPLLASQLPSAQLLPMTQPSPLPQSPTLPPPPVRGGAVVVPLPQSSPAAASPAAALPLPTPDQMAAAMAQLKQSNPLALAALLEALRSAAPQQSTTVGGAGPGTFAAPPPAPSGMTPAVYPNSTAGTSPFRMGPQPSVDVSPSSLLATPPGAAWAVPAGAPAPARPGGQPVLAMALQRALGSGLLDVCSELPFIPMPPSQTQPSQIFIDLMQANELIIQVCIPQRTRIRTDVCTRSHHMCMHPPTLATRAFPLASPPPVAHVLLSLYFCASQQEAIIRQYELQQQQQQQPHMPDPPTAGPFSPAVSLSPRSQLIPPPPPPSPLPQSLPLHLSPRLAHTPSPRASQAPSPTPPGMVGPHAALHGHGAGGGSAGNSAGGGGGGGVGAGVRPTAPWYTR